MILNNIKMLITIVNRSDGEKTESMLQNCDLFLQFSCEAQGSQGSDFLALLGVGTLEKTVVFGIAPGERIDKALFDIRESLELEKAGHGIAFTVPLDTENRGNDKMKSEYSMLMTVANPGASAEIVATAKEAGARGGTIISAKQAGSNDVVDFLGISIQSEKEIVVIVTSDEKKQAIMQAINESFGMQTSAQGVVLSVPVDAIAGMSV